MKETKKEAGFIADGMTGNQVEARIREVLENISKYFFEKSLDHRLKTVHFVVYIV